MQSNHVYLIGYRGCGKSTVGRILARKLNRPAIDSDELIEQNAAKTIREIFASESESGFRDREEAVIREIAEKAAPAVVALGGGVILRASNRKLIGTTGRSIWLRAAPEILYERIVGDATTAERRPNLSQSGGLTEIIDMLKLREPLYREMAELVVETESRTAESIADDVLEWLSKSTCQLRTKDQPRT